jgi:protein associated with RNAse G/E
MAGLSWAGTYGGGIVLDTDEGIVALENHQTLVLEREPAIAVKTYPNSQWYRRLASVITEDGVNLIAMLRDSYFEDPEEDV